MIQESAKTLIQEHFNELPSVVQDVVLNSNWEEKIRRIVSNYKLHIDQGAAIENLVFVTMLGMETPEDFVENAKVYANVSEEQAFSISAEVERSIFGDVRKKLIEITDTAETVGDIDRVTDELSKVADDIEKQSKLETEDGYKEVKPVEKRDVYESSYKSYSPEFAEKKDVPSGGEEIELSAKPSSTGQKEEILDLDNETEDEEIFFPSSKAAESLDSINKKLHDDPTLTKTATKIEKPYIPEPSKESEAKESVVDDIISEKLGGVSATKKEGDVSTENKKPAPSIATRDVKGNYKASDPYREDIV
ncbi:hypothetical protein N9L18_00140 [Candidatus Pacebacteria bacterium]|nr:hypothetical protein [Candidatus Paceibacterota bacterium]